LDLYSPNVGTRTRGFYRLFALCLLLNVVMVATLAFAAAAGALLAYRIVL
jgi:hypothetical protein